MDKRKAWVKLRKVEAQNELQLAREYRTAWAYARYPR